MCVNTAKELFYKTRSTSGSIPTLLCVVILQRSSSTRQGAPVGVYLSCCVWLYCRGALIHDKEHQWEYTYPFVCVNTAEELFYKTRSTSGSISTLLCALILQRTSSTRQGAPVGVYIPCFVCKYCKGALLQDKEHQWEYTYPVVCGNTAEALLQDEEHQWEYIYPVVCVNTAEELFFKTRNTSGSISTLLCVLILQRSSSTRQGAPVGVYLSCCVWLYCRGALLQGKEHQWEYTYPVVCSNTAEELFYKTRRTSGCISTLLCVLILQRSSSTRQGAPVGVHLPSCVC